MTKSNTRFNLEKNPTLHEVILVEETLRDSNESIITILQLKKLLHGKINQNTLNIILDYLEEEDKITVYSKGITWIKNNKKLSELLDKLLEKSELTEEDALRMGRKIKQGIAKQHALVK